MELLTMPLRFRVWNNFDKKFLTNDELLDFFNGYVNFYDEEAAISGGRDFEISQDTGCKDVDDTELYTGDIVEDVLFNKGVRYIIQYNGYTIMACHASGLEESLFASGSKFRKIGDIWQTPEYLEER